MKTALEAKIKRGQGSWDYIYINLGFTLSIAGAVISMSPITWPCNILLYAAISLIAGILFLTNGWFQNKLIGFKNKMEDSFR